MRFLLFPFVGSGHAWRSVVRGVLPTVLAFGTLLGFFVCGSQFSVRKLLIRKMFAACSFIIGNQ